MLLALARADPVRGTEAQTALAGRAEELARRLPVPERASALADLAEAVATAGQFAWAEELLRGVTGHVRPARIWTRLAVAAARAGDHGRATLWANRVQRTMKDAKVEDLYELAAVYAAAGDPDQAVRLVKRTSFVHWGGFSHDERAERWEAVVATTADLGGWARARDLAVLIVDPHTRSRALIIVAGAARSAGESAQTLDLIKASRNAALMIEDPLHRVRALIEVIPAAADDRAAVAEIVEFLVVEVDLIAGPGRKVKSLVAAAGAVRAAGGDATALVDQADAVIAAIGAPAEKALALSALAGVADGERARALVVRALAAGPWRISLARLAAIEPAAISAMADQLLSTP